MILRMISVTSPDAAREIERLGRIPDAMAASIADHLRIVAEEVATEGKLRCPVDTGALRNSIHADSPETDPTTGAVSVRVVAGEGLPYARYQHETEGLHHPVGESRFLTKAIDALRPQIEQAVRDGAEAGLQEE